MNRATSTQARAAAMIRQDLKVVWPAIKFRVTSQGYSMGDNVNVSWIDGPRQDEVQDMLAKYQYGHFNGTEDLYEVTNNRDDIPQTKYLFCSRDASLRRKQHAVAYLQNYTDIEVWLSDTGYVEGPFSDQWREWPSTIVHRMLTGYYAKSLPDMDFSKGDA